MSVVLGRERYVTRVTAPYTPYAVKEFKARLRSAVRNVWDTVEGEELREALSRASYEYGEALRSESRDIANRYRAIAERFGIREKYKAIWGKR